MTCWPFISSASKIAAPNFALIASMSGSSLISTVGMMAGARAAGFFGAPSAGLAAAGLSPAAAGGFAAAAGFAAGAGFSAGFSAAAAGFSAGGFAAAGFSAAGFSSASAAG